MKKTEPALPPKKCLPFGWVVKTSKTYPDRVYYFNTRTNASSWEQPSLVSQKEYLASIPPNELNKRLQKSGVPVVPITPTKTSKPPKYSQGSSGLGDEEFSPSFTDSDGPSQSDTDAEEPSLTDFQKKILEKEEEESDLEDKNSEQELQDKTKQTKAETNSKDSIEESDSDTHSKTSRKRQKSDPTFSVSNALSSIRGHYSDESSIHSSIHSSPQKVNLIQRKPQKRKLEDNSNVSGHSANKLSFTVCGTLNSLRKQNSPEYLSPKPKKKYSPIKFNLNTNQSSSNLDSVHIPSNTSLSRLNCKLRLGQCSGDDFTSKRTVINQSESGTVINQSESSTVINQSESSTVSNRLVHDSDPVKHLHVYIQDKYERQIEPSDKRQVLSGCDLRLKLIKKKDGSEHENSENSDLPAPKKHQIQNWINSISDTELLPTDFPPSPVSKTSSKSDDSTMLTGNKDRRVILTSDQPTDSGYSSSSITTTIQHTPLLIPSKGIDCHIGPETPVTLGEDEEEEMEIDEQEEEMMIVDLQEVRGEVSAIPELAIGTLTKQDSSECQILQETHKDRLFIIIDTNILVQSLKFLQNLTETVITDFGLPFIVIPWVVMQELDFIKDGKSKHTVSQVTKFQAMKAVKFLYSCLQNKHPRVIGQTAFNSRQILDNFTIECNDDRVLQCCFSYTHKYPNGKIVLLSDDFNLCNKATISDISAFTKNDLFKGLKAFNGNVESKPVTMIIKKDSQCIQKKISTKNTRPSTVVLPPSHKTSVKTSVKTIPKQQLSQYDERKLVDEILCTVKEEIKRSLSVVLETEMKLAFHNIWKCIVLRKPPWSALDIMESIQKHWIGVFGLVLDRRKKIIVDDIVTSLRYKTVRDIEVIKILIHNVIEFITVCESRERYNGVLEESKTNLNRLLLKCQPKSVTFISPVKDELESPIHSPPSQTEESEEDLLNSVQDRFQVIWSAIHDCSDNLPNLENATSILQLIIPVITELRHQFALCLSISPTSISTQRVHFESFTHSLNSFFSKMQADSPKPILSHALISFFTIPVKRQTLVSGLEQLDQMICKFHAYIQMM